MLSFTTAAGRKVVKAFQQLLKAYDGLEKQQAPKRQKEAKKFEASRKAELKRKTKDIKFLKKQLAEKRKTAKEKGHLNDHTRLYIQQVKARLQEAESAKRELSLLLQPLKETVLIPRQTCTDTAPQPTTSQSQPSTDQTGHAITGVNSSAAQLSTVTDTVVASASVGPQVEQLQQENELLKAAVSQQDTLVGQYRVAMERSVERNKQWKEKAKCLRERIHSDFTSMFEQSCAHETRMLQIVDYHGAKESSMVCMHLHEARTIVDTFKQALLDHYHVALP